MDEKTLRSSILREIAQIAIKTAGGVPKGRHTSEAGVVLRKFAVDLLDRSQEILRGKDES